MSKRINITNQKFNKLAVIEYAFTKNGKAYWHCKCDCGKNAMLQGDRIKRGIAKSCGCFHIENGIKSGKAKKGQTWGKRNHIKYKVEYSIWCGMKKRCYNSNEESFQYYGERGIRVCQRYKESFDEFISDIGKRPFSHYQIDRLDNNSHYSCGKCPECLENKWTMNIHWTSNYQQCRNKRSNHIITHNGVSMCITDWANKVGKNYSVVYARIKRGWSIEDALSIPVRVRCST